MPTNKNPRKSTRKRKRKSSVLTKVTPRKSTTKKKVYFTGSKNGKATFGTKKNTKIVGSVGAPKRKKKK